MKAFVRTLPFLLEVATVLAAPNWDLVSHGTVEDFKWMRSWPEDDSPLNGFDVKCEVSETFRGLHFTVHDLHDPWPMGLAPWASQINELLHSRAYPGSWDGTNVKGDHREFVVMDWNHVPLHVRDWVEKELKDDEGSRKRFLGVYEKPKVGSSVEAAAATGAVKDEDKILLIAPGEMYWELPLWVAGKSKCEADLLDLSRYVPRAMGTAVIAWITNHPSNLLQKPDKESESRDVKFTIEAKLVVETEDGKQYREFWEKAQRMMERNQRKIVREERAAARKSLDDERGIKDEL